MKIYKYIVQLISISLFQKINRGKKERISVRKNEKKEENKRRHGAK